MMKRIISFLSFVFSLVILFSCEPGHDRNGDLLFGVKIPEPPRLLKKMTSNSFNGETEVITYNYVSNKLVSAVDGYDGVTLFEYNTDNKISKVTGYSAVSKFDYIQKNVSKITTEIDSLSINTIDFTYTGSQVTKAISIHEYLLPIPKKIYLETLYEYTGANVTKAIQKTGTYLPNGQLQMNPQDTTLTFTYDKKKSPYQLFPKEFVTYLVSTELYGPALLSTANFTKMSISGGTTPASTTYSYTYDKADYPVKMTFADGVKKFEY